MATPPTRVTSAVPASGNYTTSGTSKVTGAFDVQSGDLIVVVASSEQAGTNSSVTPSASGGSVTWTLRASQTAGTTNQSGAWLWTGAVGATATGITVTVPRPNTGTTLWWGCSAAVWRGHGGVGQVVQTSSGTSSSIAQATTPSLSANSAFQVGMSDWNAVALATRTWQTVNGAAMTESLYVNGASHATALGGYRTDVGAAGTKTVGLTTPATLRWVMVGVEILGTTSGTDAPVTSPVATSTATAIAPAASAGSNATAPVATATALALPPAVSTAGVITIAPPVATATGTAVVPGAGAGLTITSGVMTGSATAYAPTLSLGTTLAAPRPTASGTALAPLVTSGSTATAPVATAAAQALSPTFGGPVTILAPPATATAVAPAPLVVAGSANVNIAAPASTATATALVPYVGVPGMSGVFTPPTIEQHSDDPFFGRYGIPVGMSVVKRDGVFQVVPIPWLGEIHDLQDGVDYFLGGHTYVVDSAVAAQLVASGFTVQQSSGYGEDPYGSQGYGY